MLGISRSACFCVLFLLLATTCPAADPSSARADSGPVVIATLADGPSRAAWQLEEVFRDELVDLVEGEIDLRFESYQGDWSQEGLHRELERAYADPEVDLVLVTGLVANQTLGHRESYAKPTFLPLVADARLLGFPRAGAGSGKENLHYLSDEIDFSRDLVDFLDIVPFRKLTLLADRLVFDAVSSVRVDAVRVSSESGVELTTIPYDDPDGDILSLIPADTEAIMIDGLGRLREEAVDRLIEGLIERQLPSFSLLGPELVERGLLISNVRDSDTLRIARRNALAIQSVLFGEAASDQPVSFDAKNRILLNLDTAQQIDVWPSYRTIVEAQLIGGDLGAGGEPLGLANAAREALRANLDLLFESYGVDAGAEDIRSARANFLPQVSSDLTGVRLDSGNSAVASGAAAESSLTGAVGVTQLVFSESARANLDIQRTLHQSRQAELDAFRLDTVQAATLAFLDILRAETAFRIQRDNLERTQTNLELAQDRVRVGSSYAADVYRWESELAAARQSAINAHATRRQARENLNRILHRDLTEPIALEPPSLDDGEIFSSSEELEALIDNPKGFQLVSEILVERGVARAPELGALELAIEAKERELLANQRAFYLPDVALAGEISHVLAEDRLPGVPSLEGESDWNLALSVTLPLFDGGARRAKVNKAEIELEQLRTRFESSRERIEQNIRSQMHSANASYSNIELAEEGAEWALKNLELVADAYGEGAVDIVQLLDAQSATLQAEEAASNAIYDFLIDLMNVNRAVGHYDLFLGPTERQDLLNELTARIQRGQS